MKKQELKMWPLEKFVEYEKNPRVNDHAVDKIASAIKEFGFRVPMLAKSSGLIVDGHLRLKAARKLGMKTIPVLLADDMSDKQIKAFRISVNKMADLADWDYDLLRIEMGELNASGFDMGLLGFGDRELVKFMAAYGAPDTSPQLTDGFKFSVIVGAKDEADQARLIERFEAEGLKCRPLP